MEELARPTGAAPASCPPRPPATGLPLPESGDLAGAPDADACARTESEPARWRQWLAGSPREVLGRIVRDDPLGVRERVAAHLREQAWLVDADRIELRTLARCARHAPRYQGRPELASWVEAHVSAAIEDLLREEAETEPGPESAGLPGEVPAVFVTLARPLGLEPAAMRRACSHFNRLPYEERRAFFDLLILGRSLDELARAGGVGATLIARRARRALEVILHGPAAPEPGAAASPAADPARDAEGGASSQQTAPKEGGR